jgi:hypothetical protein
MTKCSICSGNACDIEQNRVNVLPVQSDKAYAEMHYYLHKYETLESNFSKKSKLTRLVAKWSLPIVVLTIACLVIEHQANLVLPSFLSYLRELKPYLPLFLIIGLTLFTWAFFANRISGYTRGWSRNRLMREHLQRMIRDYQLAIYLQDEAYILIEQENTLAKLSQLEEMNRIQTHRDIVGDYLAAHEGTFSWIKGLRK